MKKKIGSGKQILNRIMDELSTRVIENSNLFEATKMLWTGLLYHCSTASETFKLVSLLKWGSYIDKEGNLTKQGIATRDSGIFISDIFESIADDEALKERIMSIYPELSSDEFEAATLACWALVSSSQMYTELLSVECDEIDVDDRVDSMMKAYENYKEEKSAYLDRNY